VGIAKARDRFRPVIPIAIRATLDAPHFGAILHQARALLASYNLLLQDIESCQLSRSGQLIRLTGNGGAHVFERSFQRREVRIRIGLNGAGEQRHQFGVTPSTADLFLHDRERIFRR
jgi:hypothetical protein